MTDAFIDHIVKRLHKKQKVHRRLPNGGLLHIDRPLPFLLVSSCQFKNDTVPERLVRTQASYLIATDEKESDVKKLLKAVVAELSDQFGAFLVLDIWSLDVKEEDAPAFTIFGPAEKLPASVSAIADALKDLHLPQQNLQVTIKTNSELIHGKKALLQEGELKQLSCLMLGLQMKPFYFHPNSQRTYPLLVRQFRTEFSKVIQKTMFEFMRIQTNIEPKHFQVLGRQDVVRSVWQIDKQLVEISQKLRFLMLVTPINADAAWAEFQESKFKETPAFHYRLMPVDPELLKRQLYNIPIERVEDPTLGFLFRDKRHELDKMLTMLADREKPDFMYSSLQLFGGVDEELLKIAEGLLAALPKPDPSEKTDYIPVTEFAKLARAEINYLKEQDTAVTAKVEIREDIISLMVSKGQFLIGKNAHVPRHRAEALIQHEVGTHVLTYYNGKAQPLQQLYAGVPGYEELQEGLAVLSEYLVGGLDAARMRVLAARVVAVHNLINGSTFIENFRMLHEQFEFDAEDAFDIALRVHRGGGLTKDAVYLRGLVHLLNYLKEGNDLEPLLIGKIRQDYIPIVQELIYRNILRPMPLKPRYLTDPVFKPKLELLQKGITVFNLI